jgi:hypothetical protein
MVLCISWLCFAVEDVPLDARKILWVILTQYIHKVKA